MDQGCSRIKTNLTRSLIDIFPEENRFHPKVGQLSVGVFAAIANRRNSARIHRLAGIGIGTEWTSRGQVTGPFLGREKNAFVTVSGIGRQFRRSQKGQSALPQRRIIRLCPRVESCSNKKARQTSKSYRNKTRMTVCTPLVISWQELPESARVPCRSTDREHTRRSFSLPLRSALRRKAPGDVSQLPRDS